MAREIREANRESEKGTKMGEICHRLATEVGFRVKDAVSTKGKKGILTAENITAEYKTYITQMKNIDVAQYNALGSTVVDRYLYEDAFTLKDVAFIMGWGHSTAGRQAQIWQTNGGNV